MNLMTFILIGIIWALGCIITICVLIERSREKKTKSSRSKKYSNRAIIITKKFKAGN